MSSFNQNNKNNKNNNQILFSQNIQHLKSIIYNNNQSKTLRLLASLDYLDKLLSNYLQTQDNILFYYVLGVFGWIFNREKSLIMVMMVAMVSCRKPEKMVELLRVKGVDVGSLEGRVMVSVFVSLYMCMNCLIMIFMIIKPLKKCLNRDRPIA